MKLVLFCGGLEPGHDGVGDYTRRLAGELIRQGHVCRLVALNDTKITALAIEPHYDHGTEIGTVRIPSCRPWSERVRFLTDFVRDFEPERISLQYVPFSFHAKGLPFRFAARFKKISCGRPVVLMFHETWVGISADASIKLLLWGRVQQLIFLHMFHLLRPLVVHSTTALYKSKLEGLGQPVKKLPLFSNLPVRHPEEVAAKIAAWPIKAEQVDLVVFGSVYPGAPVDTFAREAKAYEAAHGITFNLVVIGRSNQHQENLLRHWTEQGLRAKVMGQMDEADVSAVLTKIHFGIFTTPLGLIEKSSAVATMWAHGIHMLCVAPEYQARGAAVTDANPYRFMQYEEGRLASFMESSPFFSYMPTISKVAQQFIEDLQ